MTFSLDMKTGKLIFHFLRKWSGSFAIRHDLITPSSCLISSCLISFGLIFSCLISPSSAQPSHPHRLDLSLAYTRVEQTGDWQRGILGYGYLMEQNPNRVLSFGGSLQAHRREFSLEPFTDPFGSLWTHWNNQNWGLDAQIEGSIRPKFLPNWGIQLRPYHRFNFKTQSLEIASLYRFAQYQIASSQLFTPSLTWTHPSWSLGFYLYLTFPEYGPNFLTPQFRFSKKISYFWRFGLWGLYGYDTLNDRFVDPNRQAPLWNLYGYVQHLWNDWQGTRIGLSYLHFLPQSFQQAQERFNQNRLEISLHHYWRFD